MAIGDHINNEYMDEVLLDDINVTIDVKKKNRFELKSALTKKLIEEIDNKWTKDCADSDSKQDVSTRLSNEATRYEVIKEHCTLSYELVLCIIEKQIYANICWEFFCLLL